MNGSFTSDRRVAFMILERREHEAFARNASGFVALARNGSSLIEHLIRSGYLPGLIGVGSNAGGP